MEPTSAVQKLLDFEKKIPHDVAEVPPDLLIEHIFDAIPAVVVLLDRTGEVVRANHKAREFVDCTTSSEHAVGRKCEKPCATCRLKMLAHSPEDARVLLGEPIHGIVRQFQDHDGIWMRMDKIPYRNHEGTIDGLLIFGIDVTDMVEPDKGTH